MNERGKRVEANCDKGKLNRINIYRAAGEPVGFPEYIQKDSIDSFKEGRLLLRLQKFRLDKTEELEQEIQKIKQEKAEIKSLGEHSAVLLPAEEITDPSEDPSSKWVPDLDDDLSDDFYAGESPPKKTKKNAKQKTKKAKKTPSTEEAMSEDSEEEETITL